MAFRINFRGGRAPMVAEYECPVHGRFDRVVDRTENGDPPEAQPCPMLAMCKPDALGLCRDCGELVELYCQPCTRACEIESEYRISAVAGRVRVGEVVRGTSELPPHALALDTQDLADGMPYNDWKKKRTKLWRDEMRKRRKDADA
jgi:hypothetical protein